MMRREGFKQIFKPRAVVGLQVTETSLALVKVINTLKGTEIAETRAVDVDKPENRVDRLRSMFEQPGLKYDLLITSIPSVHGSFRRISVPFRKRRKLDKIIRYQMEPYIPTPIDDVLVDYLPAGPDGSVVAVGLEKKILKHHLELLRNAGLEPDMVLLDEVAVFSLYGASLHGEEGDQAPAAIIHFGEGSVGIQIAYRKAVEFVRILPETENIISAIADTFKIYSLQEESLTPDHIFLMGGYPPEKEITKRIEDITGIQVTVWKPWEGIRTRSENTFQSNPLRFAVPLGAALNVATGTSRSFNFRKEEFSIQSAVDLRRKFGTILVLLFVLAGMLTFHLYQKEHIQIKKYGEIKNRMRSVFLTAFPETKRLVKGQELAQMKQKVAQERTRLAWISENEAGDSILEMLKVITDRMARFPNLYLENLSIDGKEMEIEGNASNFEMVDKLKEAFQKSNSFSAVKLAGAKTTRQEGKVQFHMMLVKK
ncbi:MAG: PilN domain-containing protein [Desulfatiglandaceae bacterium]